jgi:selenide,water dikinase
VTGYELLGHAGEMVLEAVIRRGSVPVWDRAQELASAGCYAAGLAANREHREADVVADGVDEEELLPLYDPQTSGGLLIAVGAARVEDLVAAPQARGEGAAIVGEVTEERVLRITP